MDTDGEGGSLSTPFVVTDIKYMVHVYTCSAEPISLHKQIQLKHF